VQAPIATRFSRHVSRDTPPARLIVQQYKTEMLPRADTSYRFTTTNHQRMAGRISSGADLPTNSVSIGGGLRSSARECMASALVIRGFG